MIRDERVTSPYSISQIKDDKRDVSNHRHDRPKSWPVSLSQVISAKLGGYRAVSNEPKRHKTDAT